MERKTKYCPARPGKRFHDDERTGTTKSETRLDGSEWVRHWWICRLCGEGVWWW